MNRIRVLVAEDSLTIRKLLCEVLGSDPSLEIVGEAEDGKQAIDLCLALRPDVITMDMMMPVMSGLAATEYIMAHCPTPILVVSSSTNRGELFKTYETLAAGAVEVMEKPEAGDAPEQWERKFLATLKVVARIKVITHLRARLNGFGTNGQPVENAGAAVGRPTGDQHCDLIAIGTSTGGPRAIVEILRALPTAFPIPILLLIHIGDPFGAAFAEWLDGQSQNRVRLAQEGQSLTAPGIYLAPSNRHLVAHSGKLHLSSAPERHSCRPSVDVLFESLAAECGNSVAACLLTGMGVDGACGLLAVRQAGGTTIAQDEASSVIYGMPREAVLLGAAQYVLPLVEIGPALVRMTRRSRAAGSA